MDARERPRVLARRAGHSPGALGRSAPATLPADVSGTRLDDRGVAAISAAVEVCAQAGMSDAHVALIVDDYRARFGEQWRRSFWTGRLRAAALRFEHPALYGPSPCDVPAPLAAEPPYETTLAASGCEPVDLPVLSTDIHPAVAAAPVVRGRAVA